MSQSEWVVAATRSKLPKVGVLPVYPRGVAVLLVRQGDDELFALANRCPHMSCPLESGRLAGGIITCPCHDWSFHVRTGEMVSAPEIRVVMYPVKSDGEDILVKLPGA